MPALRFSAMPKRRGVWALSLTFVLPACLLFSGVEACAESGTGSIFSLLQLRGGESKFDLMGWLSPPVPDLRERKTAPARPSKSWSGELSLSGKGEKAGAAARRANIKVKKIAEDVCSPESVEQTIIIEASPEECFQAATNFEDYYQWAGAIKSVEVLERQKDGLGHLVEFEMGIFGMSTRNTMAYRYHRPNRMNWHVTKGGIKELVGSYEFIQIGPDRTKVIYKLRVEPGFPFPQVLKKATSRAVASAALNDLKKWTESVRAKRLNPSLGKDSEDEQAPPWEADASTKAVRQLIPLC